MQALSALVCRPNSYSLYQTGLVSCLADAAAQFLQVGLTSAVAEGLARGTVGPPPVATCRWLKHQLI